MEDNFFKMITKFIFLFPFGFSSSVVVDFSVEPDPFIPISFCLLPPELGYSGEIKYLEDCQSLDQYETFPLPEHFFRKVGIHPVVCCPQILPYSSICFESDAWCHDYKMPEPVSYDPMDDQYSNQYYDLFRDYKITEPVSYDPKDDQYSDEYFDLIRKRSTDIDHVRYDLTDELLDEQQVIEDYEKDYGNIPIVTDPPIPFWENPKMADKDCSLNGQYPILSGVRLLSECVPLNQCGNILNNEFAPQIQIQVCGFDVNVEMLMICCPENAVTEPESFEQRPRFPARSGEARQVEDRSDLCRKWSYYDGCTLDKDIVISKLDPYNGKVNSKALFDFMQGACLKTCGWAEQKGCVDEHPMCPDWVRKGMCHISPFFMTHTCRESCGVCGFLSPFNTEEQVVGNFSYTNLTRNDFDCGRYKPLCEINNEFCGTKRNAEYSEDVSVNTKPNITELLDDDVFLAIDPDNANSEIFCGGTMVSDRWAVGAAHCFDEFLVSADSKPRQIKINIVRHSTKHYEIVEIKRVYKHPSYKYPNLYDDISVIELGRRVVYNYDLFGDTPSCIDLGQDLVGKIAKAQGFGLTNTGERGHLLESTVTIISNDICKEYLDYNSTDNSLVRQKIDKALPHGLNYGLLCAQGEQYLDGTFGGPCKGDSGGPLTTISDDDRTTLVGIVSGGIGCGKGYPGWYTKISFHVTWILCIIENSVLDQNFEKVSKECERASSKPPQSEPVSYDPMDDLYSDQYYDEDLIDLRG